MDRKVIDEINAQFQALVAIVPIHTIRSEAEYMKAVSVLNQLLDAGGADETSPLADLINSLGTFIADYEDMETRR